MPGLAALAFAVTAAAQAPLDDTRWLERLQHWTAAIDRHEIGALDDAASEVAAWSIADIQSLAVDVKLLVFLMRRDADPNEFRVRLPDKSGRTTMVRWRFIARAEAELLQTLAHSEARHGDANRLLKRGAMLHSDVAMLTSGPEQPADSSGNLKPRRVQVYFADGRGLAVMDTTPHWNIARGLLDDVQPSPARDDMVRAWYQATLAYQQGKEQLDPGHTDRALALFPKDADILFFAGCLHETFAAPAAHDALRGMTVPSGLRLDLGSADGELRLAERMFREALNERSDLVEARIRFGRVLGAIGRHEDAAKELRRAASEAADPLLLYYANLFAGAEEATLNRVDSARAAYQRASSLFPLAQSPHLALSLLARRANDREAARQTIERVLAPPEFDERDDPWWRYHTVQGRTVDERLDALRRLVPN